VSTNTAQSVLTAEQVASGIRLPDRDVRKALDESVFRGWTEHTRRLTRVVCLLAADTLAGLIGVATVINTWGLVSNEGARPVPKAIPLIAMVCCIQPLALRVTGAYGGGRARASIERIFSAMVIAGLIGWIQARLFGELSPNLPNKTAYVYSAALIALFIWLERVAFAQAVKLGYSKGLLQRRVLLIAHREELEDVQRRVDHATASDVRIVAALSPRHLSGSMKVVDDAINSSKAQAVAVASGLPSETLNSLIDRCFANGIGISLLPSGVQDQGAAHFELFPSNIGLLLELFPMRFGLPQLAVKRTMDILLTVAGLLLVWPVFLIVAIAIKLDSKGPVFFSQERVGVGGRPFRMLKFRTMRIGADEMKSELQGLNESGDPRLFKIKNDPRVTPVGRLLRRTSLDELPQLLNVLKGEMSLVGPRPFFRGDLPGYDSHHFERLHVLPGITGLWQVSGRSDVVDFEEVVRLDRRYIQEWSVGADLMILLKTIPAALGRGAY
jgi:exopolysaccharide biosynthesis polyprenyl glycosylphosphotransferase